MAQATIDKNPRGMAEPNTTTSSDLPATVEMANENSVPPAKKKRGRKPKNVAEVVAPAAAGKNKKTVVEGNLDKALCQAMDAILRKRGLTRQQFCGLLAPSEKGYMAPDVLSATRDSIVDEAIGLHQAAKNEMAQDVHLGKFIVHDSPEKIVLSSESIAEQARHMFSDSDEAGSEDEEGDSGAESEGALAEGVRQYEAAWMNVADELLSADAVLEDSKPLCSEDAATLVAAMTLPQIRTRLADRLQVPDYAVGRLTGMRARLHLMRMLRKELLKDAGSCDAEQDPPRSADWMAGMVPSAADGPRWQHGAALPAFDAPWLHTYEVPARYPAPRARSHPGPGSRPEAPESPLRPPPPPPHPRSPLQHSRFPLHVPPRQEELHAAGKKKKIVRFATTAKKCLKNALAAFAHGATQAAVQSVLPM